ncbi:MAG: flap endonuclease-1 [Candidatus Altiarchaeota archaeon]
MGVNLRDIIDQKPIELSQLSGKTIAVDALNSLYQFLASIRQPDGTLLMDSNGNVTSHLSGLFYRTTRLLKIGVKPVYVFDGQPPELKKHELDRRRKVKEEAAREWEKAKSEGRIDDARKYAMRTSKLTKEMREESKRLLGFMGVPFIQAPGEGEAQCALLVERGDAWACGSQDYDALLFGAKRLVKGLTLSGELELAMIDLDEALSRLGISREQLVDVALLIGTDFNEGVKGIGPKKGLAAVKEGGAGGFDVPNLEELRSIFLKPSVTEDYEVKWSGVDTEGLVGFLSGEHGFSEDRIRRTSKELSGAYAEFQQASLSKWF